MKARPLLTVWLTVVFIIIIMVATPHSQSLTARNSGAGGLAPAKVDEIQLLVGRSTVLNTDSPITRVSVTTPDIADALVTSQRQVLIHGKAPGTVSLLLWQHGGRIMSYDVVVRRDLGALEGRLHQLFPDEPITVASNGTDVVMSGTVSNKYVVEHAGAVAVGYVESAEHVVNLLRQQDDVASDQVMLQVRFAEVSRSALQELGVSFFTGANGYKDYVARATTQQFPAPDFDNEEGLVFSDFLNILAFNTKEQLGGVIKALETQGLFQSLAEPNLVTQNGSEASFLAGGEYPYPVVQGSGLNAAVTILFKEFGVRLSFTPTVIGNDLVHLKVAPEVSALDFSNAITIEGFRIPALSTRRTQTEVELRSGQTFAIAGLIDNTATETMSKIPGIGDIPILGLLFKSRAYQKNQTELIVMITPHILRADSVGVGSELPDLVKPFMDPPDRTLPPPPALPPPQAGAATLSPIASPAVGGQVNFAPADTPASASAGGRSVPAARRALTKEEAKAERKRLEEERKLAERERKAEETLARERAKREAEAAKRAAKAEATRLEEERKLAEK